MKILNTKHSFKIVIGDKMPENSKNVKRQSLLTIFRITLYIEDRIIDDKRRYTDEALSYVKNDKNIFINGTQLMKSNGITVLSLGNVEDALPKYIKQNA